MFILVYGNEFMFFVCLFVLFLISKLPFFLGIRAAYNIIKKIKNLEQIGQRSRIRVKNQPHKTIPEGEEGREKNGSVRLDVTKLSIHKIWYLDQDMRMPDSSFCQFS